MQVVGREEMIDEVVRRLGEARLVTVTGPGGIGKTTLADAVARIGADRYPLGVHWVDLTVLDDAAEVGRCSPRSRGTGRSGRCSTRRPTSRL